MDNDTIFSICSSLALLGWLGLALLPRWHITRDWLAPVISPLIIAVFYAALMGGNFGGAPEGAGFGSLAEVQLLFSVPELILAGWVHYLAFDLFVGAWEVRDAQRNGVHHLLVLPCLLATLMAGPAGLLLYWIIRLGVQAFRRNTEAAHAH